MPVVYTNSCSFGAPNQGHLIYPDVVTNHLLAKLINRGIGGSCNRRIIRTTLRDCIEIQPNLVLIGLTFISRTEAWQPWLPNNTNDGDFHPIIIDHGKLDWTKGLYTKINNIHQYADQPIRDYYQQWLLHYNPEAELYNLLTDILMLTSWLKEQGIRYLVFANTDVFPADIDYNAPFLSSLRDNILKDKSIINPWEFSFGTYARSLGHKPKDENLYGDHGHPNEQAHIDFANHLIVNYINV